MGRRFFECSLTVGRLAFVADFGILNFNLKNKFDMEHNTSINHENGNDANRLLADSALVCSGCLKKDGTVHRDMYDGLCADCTTKALYNYDFAKKAEKTNEALKRHYR